MRDRRHFNGQSRPGRDVIWNQDQRILSFWARGYPYQAIAKAMHMPVERVRSRLTTRLRVLWRAQKKWRLAEIKCAALGRELRQLRLGKEAEPDRPIETLRVPAIWLPHYLAAGIDTVHKLRAADSEFLLAHRRFPIGAVDWAIVKLDSLGLSHALVRPNAQRGGCGFRKS